MIDAERGRSGGRKRVCGANLIESNLSRVFDLALALASRTEVKALFLTHPPLPL